MGFKRSLFELERLSPKLANKVWQFGLGFDFQIRTFNDTQLEVVFTASDSARWMALAAFERASALLWERHLDFRKIKFSTISFRGDFVKEMPKSPVFLRLQLPEMERENILAELWASQKVECDLVGTVYNEQDQTLLSLNSRLLFQVRGDQSQLLQAGSSAERKP